MLLFSRFAANIDDVMPWGTQMVDELSEVGEVTGFNAPPSNHH